MSLDCRTAEVLISGWLDQELTQQQQQQLHRHLADCEHCRQHLAELERLRLDLKQVAGLNAAIRETDAIATDKVANRLFRFGWGLLLFTLLPLGVWAFVDIWRDSSLPVGLRLAVTGMMLGLLSLIIGVIRQRWLTIKTDKYKKVQL